MDEIRYQVFGQDPIMRMSLAFYNFIKNNKDWRNRIENVIANHFKALSDFDFEFSKHLYSFFYQYIDANRIRCCVKEYDAFYDNAKQYNYLLFTYNIKDNQIINVYEQGIKKLK